jgi:hypothetical protein
MKHQIHNEYDMALKKIISLTEELGEVKNGPVAEVSVVKDALEQTGS